MKTRLICCEWNEGTSPERVDRRGGSARAVLSILAGLGLAGLLGGCSTPAGVTTPTAEDLRPNVSVALREGDTIRIAFPGAPEADSVQQIRVDGKVRVPLGGEMQAAGKTPEEFEKEILKAYGDQLTMKEVTVTVTEASYPLYITGAVLKPGKMMVNKPIDILEAIMEAGGLDPINASARAVRVIREENGRSKIIKVNVKAMLDGKQTQLFYLRPSDIVYVPAKAF